MVDEFDKRLIEELKNLEFSDLYGSERAKSTIGLTLFHSRQKAGLTQKQVSEIFGVRQPYIAQLESGEANPTVGTVGKLLSRLGLKLVAEVEPLFPQEKQPLHNDISDTNKANILGGTRSSNNSIAETETQWKNSDALFLSSTADLKI